LLAVVFGILLIAGGPSVWRALRSAWACRATVKRLPANASAGADHVQLLDEQPDGRFERAFAAEHGERVQEVEGAFRSDDLAVVGVEVIAERDVVAGELAQLPHARVLDVVLGEDAVFFQKPGCRFGCATA
jgi:hypothetical protein